MRWRKKRRGQVIVMVTLALIMMCGIMGLAVDLGWAYYMEKTSQAAADAAAIAAVGKAFDLVGGAGAAEGAYSTQDAALPPVRCSSAPAGGALAEGCLYAQRNGFTDNVSGRQAVYMSAGAYSIAPTAPRVGTVLYWATAVVAERIPQLFSAVMGNPMGGASSRATAAVVWATVPGSIYGLDRQNDFGVPGLSGRGLTGTDLFIQGGGSVRAGGDIYLASTASGASGRYASDGNGGWEVWAQNGNTYMRGSGWTTEPDNFYAGDPPVPDEPIRWQPDDDRFYDPLAGKGQPPPPTGLAPCPIPEVKVGSEWFGVVSAATSTVWGPGNYYAVDANNQPTGSRLLFDPGIKFGASGSCAAGAESAGGFGGYVFYGGVKLPSGTVTFEPGRYVLAGALEARNGRPGVLVDGRTQTYLTDNTPLVMEGGVLTAKPNVDAGEIFIFTDANYPGLQVPSELSSIQSLLRFGIVDLQSGSASTRTEMNLHGLNASHAAIPAELKNFEPVVFWQDQRNSTVRYTEDGYYSCGQPDGYECAEGRNIDWPDYTTITNGSPEMNLQATPSTHLFGVVYQPRGAWMILHGGNEQVVSPLTLISGAFQIQGGPAAVLRPMSRPMRRQVVALVE